MKKNTLRFLFCSLMCLCGALAGMGASPSKPEGVWDSACRSDDQSFSDLAAAPGGPHDYCSRCCLFADPCTCSGCSCYPGLLACGIGQCSTAQARNLAAIQPSTPRDLLQNYDKNENTLRQFRDHILLKSERSQRFVHLYYFHSPAVSEIFKAEPSLAIRMLGLIVKIAPGLQAILNDSSTPRVSESLQSELGSFAEALASAAEQHGRPKLASDIRREIKPFTEKHLAGMTFPQAWRLIGGD